MSTDVTSILNCEDEPIRTPGSIQPHGVLLVIKDDKTLEITHASENCGSLLGGNGSQVLGRRLEEFVGETTITTLQSALETGLEEANPISATLKTGHSQTYDLIAHRSGENVILEIEPVDVRYDTGVATYAQIQKAMLRLNAAPSLEEVALVLAEEVQLITGFDRVMIYRFDQDWCGDVIGEARLDDRPSFMGQRFPASDIPAQARALYTENWTRIIGDVSYEATPIYGISGSEPLDLSQSTLRSVSPFHIAYLRNMGVKASMSVSLIEDGELWGLIACHHYSDRRLLPYKARAASELVGQFGSVLLTAREQSAQLESFAGIESPKMTLIESLQQGSGDVVSALTAFSPTIADVLNSTGAAVCINSKVTTIGEVPSDHWLKAIAAEMHTLGPNATYSTDSLSRINSLFAPISEVASGVLAVAVGDSVDSWIMWFLPEILTTIEWAGDPNEKASDADAKDVGSLGPRRSFGIWKEQVSGRSRPWTAGEISAAGELARSAAEAMRLAQRSAEITEDELRELTLVESPLLNGVDLGFRYVPGESVVACSYWHDVVALPEKLVALTVGDVLGRGAVASATIVQMRSALRVFFHEEYGADEALARMNKLINWLVPRRQVASVVVEFNIENGRAVLANAGHLGPIVIRDGKASYVPMHRGPTLGTAESDAYHLTEIVLDSGDILVLFTNGLVENPTEPLDKRLDCLLQEAGNLSKLVSMDEFCEQLITQMRDPRVGPGLAMVALRRR